VIGGGRGYLYCRMHLRGGGEKVQGVAMKAARTRHRGMYVYANPSLFVCIHIY
jgi:hypothetical protein